MAPEDSPTYHLADIVTGGQFFWADSIKLAERKAAAGGAPVYMYRVDWRTPVWDGRLRSPHGVEVPFAFDNVARAPGMVGEGSGPEKMAAQMNEAWLAFASTGTPSFEGQAWPAYDISRRATMIFSLPSAVVDDVDSDARTSWASI